MLPLATGTYMYMHAAGLYSQSGLSSATQRRDKI